ncbi:MAG: hypothetical protein ACYTG7_11730 [Planctomycetota bacterium]|jgi:hypothetical protein
MTRFISLLQRINDRLALPQPAKSRIILEIAADLTDLYDAYRARVLSEEEAVEQASKRIELSDQSLARLVEIHTSPIRRWMDRLSFSARALWEKFLFVLILLFILLAAGKEILTSRFFLHANVFIWPATVLSLVVLGLGIKKLYQLFIKKDHKQKTLRSGISALLFLGFANIFTGLFGFTWELYFAMQRMQMDVDRAGDLFVQWLLGGTATMIFCLLAAIIAALIWFVLDSKASRIEQAEAAYLLYN